MVVTVYKTTFRGFSIRCHFEKGAWWATAHTRNEKGLARRSKVVFRSSKEEALFGAEYLVLRRECQLSEKPQVLIVDGEIIYGNKTARRLRSDSKVKLERELVSTSSAPIEIVTYRRVSETHAL
ncbi:MAG: hypothetical protein BRC34_15005 [Cyanobacteria bacterium QH_1_48_107]|nr:MAG: hypothetical protein BRC34_15005 [Cyanobacteria bacterium QH_1_48_107]